MRAIMTGHSWGFLDTAGNQGCSPAAQQADVPAARDGCFRVKRKEFISYPTSLPNISKGLGY